MDLSSSEKLYVFFNLVRVELMDQQVRKLEPVAILIMIEMVLLILLLLLLLFWHTELSQTLRIGHRFFLHQFVLIGISHLNDY